MDRATTASGTNNPPCQRSDPRRSIAVMSVALAFAIAGGAVASAAGTWPWPAADEASAGSPGD